MHLPTAFSLSTAVRLSLVFAVACAAGCGSTKATEPTVEAGDDTSDATLQIDVSGDMAQDAVKADTAGDAGKLDVAADAKVDATQDAAPDVAKDVAPDVAKDVAPDVAKDVVQDVAADVGSDAPVVDAGPIDAGAGDAGSDAGTSDGGGTVAGCGVGLISKDGKCSPTTAGLHVGDAESIATNTVSLYLVPPNNLLVNPGAEGGDLSGWTPTDGGDPWQVNVGDAPFGGRYFRGSYAWGYLAQTVDFVASGINPNDLDAGTPLHFGVFGIGWGFPSSAAKLDTIKLDIAYQDATGTQLGTWSSGELTLPIGTWGSVGVDTVTYPLGTRKAVFTIGSIDGEYWKGSYAATIDGANASVGALDVRVSNGDGTWTPWQPFTSTIGNWSLSAGAGLKTVQIEFRDGNGTSLGVITDTVSVQ